MDETGVDKYCICDEAGKQKDRNGGERKERNNGGGKVNRFGE